MSRPHPLAPLAATAIYLSVTLPVIAQAPGGEGTVPTDTAIPALMLFTLIAGLVIAVGGFLYFLRKRSNRAAAERVLKD